MVSDKNYVDKITKYPQDPSFQQLCELVGRGEKKIALGGLESSAKAFILSLLFRRTGKPLFVISPTEKEARALYQDLAFFLGEEQLFSYPPWDVRSTDMFSLQADDSLRRMEILAHLSRKKTAVFVFPLQALMQMVLPVRAWFDYVETIALGDMRDRDQLVEKLLAGGYKRVTLVEGKGEFGVRGSVLDIFPLTTEDPLRLEFLGDELESIRVFSATSQRSSRELCDFTLFPAGEIIMTAAGQQLAMVNIRRRANELELSALTKNRLVEALANGRTSSINPLFLPLFSASAEYDGPDGQQLPGTLIDYLPADACLVMDDYFALQQAELEIENEIDRLLLKADREESFYLEKKASYLLAGDLWKRLEGYPQLHIDGIHPGGSGGKEVEPGQEIKFRTEKNILDRAAWKMHTAAEAGPLGFLADHLKKHMAEGELVVFLCLGPEEAQRMAHLLSQHDLTIGDRFEICPPQNAASFWTELSQYHGQGRLVILDGKLAGGFHYPAGKLVVLTEEELFGRKIARRRTRPLREGYFLQSFGELNDGDYAVHTEHGIGRYRGLQKLSINGLENDFLLLEYQGGDTLYIPVYRLDVLQRYIGPSGYLPQLD